MKLKKEEIEKFFNSLVEKGIIEKDDILFDDSDFNLNKDELVEMCKTGNELRLSPDERTLEYFKDGEWHQCPSMENGIENSIIFLCDRIPQYTWNVDEEDSNMVNNEIESLYTCCVVAGIFKDVFIDEFKEVLEKYDFNRIKDGFIGENSFTELLNSWKSLQSKVLQAVCSACRENISTKKEQYSSLNVSILDKEERIKLRDLKSDIKTYFNNFKRTKLDEASTRNLKKHEIYTLYNERDEEIKKMINSSNFSSVRTLYILDKLNFEDVPVLVKKKISNTAKLEVKSLFEGKEISNSIRDEYKNKFLKKGVKVFLRKWKNDELLKYLENRESYKLPTF